jgi:hypothetical protein
MLEAIKESVGLLVETEMNDWSSVGWWCVVEWVFDGSMEEMKKDELAFGLEFGLPAT